MISLDMSNLKDKIYTRRLNKSFIKNSLYDTQIDIKLRKAVVHNGLSFVITTKMDIIVRI